MDRAFWLTLAGGGFQLFARDGKRYDYTMSAKVCRQRAQGDGIGNCPKSMDWDGGKEWPVRE